LVILILGSMNKFVWGWYDAKFLPLWWYFFLIWGSI